MHIKNIDYLSFSVDIANYDKLRNSDMFQNFAMAKKATSENTLQGKEEKAEIEMQDMYFEVLGNGAPGFSWILHNAEYEVKIAKYRSEHDEFFPLMIRIKSECLWAYGVMGAYDRICRWIETVFGKIIDNKVSRVDMACHTDDFQFTIIDINKFKGRYRKSNIRTNNRKCTGFEFGVRTADIFCRIYNKTKEVLEKLDKAWFLDIWEARGMKLSEVWNIEYELKRDFFKDRVIETVEDFFSCMDSIWRYLIREWLVYVVDDHTRRDECTVDERWIDISHEYEGTGYRELMPRDQQAKRSSDGYIPHILGVLTKYAALAGTVHDEDTVSMLLNRAKKYYDKKDTTFDDEVLRKKKLLGLVEEEPMQIEGFRNIGKLRLPGGEYGTR